jgi:type VI protein secretion system component Hcp
MWLDMWLTVFERSESGWTPTGDGRVALLGVQWGFENPPRAGSLGRITVSDVTIRKAVDSDPQSGQRLEMGIFRADQHLERLEVMVQPSRDSDDALIYTLDDCYVSSLHEFEPGIEVITIQASQFEWRWSAAAVDTRALLDMRRNNAGMGTVAVDVREPALGRRFEEAVDMYVRLPGVQGASDDRDHRGWLEVNSFRVGVDHGATSDRITNDHLLQLERRPDHLSPVLADACIQARVLEDVAVEVVALRSRRVLLSYRLRTCQVAGVRAAYGRFGQEESDDQWSESVDITFGEVEFQYFVASQTTRPAPRLAGQSASLAVPHGRVVPRSAFIIMWMAPGRPDLDEVHRTIVDVCTGAGITAVRADDIQHSEQVTEVVLERIRTSEVVIADLTGERPNVYYEVGHAHAVGKRPVLVRRRGSLVHFDLVNHNVREYETIDDLRAILTQRLAPS